MSEVKGWGVRSYRGRGRKRVGSGGPGETHPNEGGGRWKAGERSRYPAGTSSPTAIAPFFALGALCPFQLAALWSNPASALALGPCPIPCPSGFYLQQLDQAIQTPACPAWPGHRSRRREEGSATLGTNALGSPPASFPRARGQSVSPACLSSPFLSPGPQHQSDSRGSRSP